MNYFFKVTKDLIIQQFIWLLQRYLERQIEDGGEKRGLPVLREETAEEEMLVEDTEKVAVLIIISILLLLLL